MDLQKKRSQLQILNNIVSQKLQGLLYKIAKNEQLSKEEERMKSCLMRILLLHEQQENILKK